MTHREAIKGFLAKIRLANAYVIDWGSGSKPVSRYIEHENCRFTTVDKNNLISADRRSGHHITADIQTYLEIDQADYAFCMEVLEHTTFPIRVIQNIHRNLKDGGKLYMSLPYDFPIHSDDDYLRFTPNGISKLLSDAGFTVKHVDWSTVEHEGLLIEAVK